MCPPIAPSTLQSTHRNQKTPHHTVYCELFSEGAKNGPLSLSFWRRHPPGPSHFQSARPLWAAASVSAASSSRYGGGRRGCSKSRATNPGSVLAPSTPPLARSALTYYKNQKKGADVVTSDLTRRTLLRQRTANTPSTIYSNFAKMK